MSTKPISAPRDWFDNVWDQYAPQLPIYLRQHSVKELARKLLGSAIEFAGAQAKTPEGMRQLIAFAKIQAILKGAQGVMSGPDPSPEEIAAAVERLVERAKP